MSLSHDLYQERAFGGLVENASAPDTGPTTRDLLSIKSVIHARLLEEVEPSRLHAMRDDDLIHHVVSATALVIRERSLALPGRLIEQLHKDVQHELRGYGPIQPLLDDASITEIMVNGPGDVYVERYGRISRADVYFQDEQHIRRIIERIVAPLGRRIDEASPMVDARLRDGSRVNAIIPPLSVKGPVLTVRKFSHKPFTDEDLLRMGTFTEPMRDFLRAAVGARLNIIVSGGTGSGKTTTLNTLTSFIPEEERIVTIEDAAELQPQQEHVITLESRPANLEGKGEVPIRALVRNSLRMRPDRIVVGEVRGGEALDMLQAMNTGHDGSLSTVHSNTPRDTLSRIETMVLMSGTTLPSRAIREQVSSAIHLVVHQARLRDGSRRVTNISELVGMDGDVIVMQDLFLWDQRGIGEDGSVQGQHRATGIRPRCIEKMQTEGYDLAGSMFNR